MENLSSRELMENLKAAGSNGMKSVAFLPVGCFEQHGPFLPLETDSLIAQGISKDVSSALKDRYCVYVFPVVQYTPSQANANYTGTVSVPDDSFRIYMREVCAAIMQTGFDALVLIAGHAGAESSLREIAFWNVNAQYGRKEGNIRPVFVVSIFDAAPQIEEKFGQKSGRHADWREFLLLYHILGKEYFTDDKLLAMEMFQKNNSFNISASRIYGAPMEYRSTEGVLGDPMPNFGSDYEKISEELWGFLVENIMQKISLELNGFWARTVGQRQ